jgi:WD40 repeat protein
MIHLPGGADGVVKLWDLRRTGDPAASRPTPLAVGGVHTGCVVSLAFAGSQADGRPGACMLLSAASDGCVATWNLHEAHCKGAC